MKACRDNKVKNPGGNFASLHANWPNCKKMEAAIEDMHVEIRKKSRPKSHRFVLERAKER